MRTEVMAEKCRSIQLAPVLVVEPNCGRNEFGGFAQDGRVFCLLRVEEMRRAVQECGEAVGVKEEEVGRALGILRASDFLGFVVEVRKNEAELERLLGGSGAKLVLPGASVARDEAEVGEAVDEELHGEGDQQKSHDAHQDANAGFTEEDADAIGAAEDKIADEGGEGNGAEDGQHLPVVGCLADEDHDARDGSRAGQHGNAEGDNAGVFFGGGFFGFVLGFLSGGAAGLHHVDANQHEDEAAGDLEGGELDPEEAEDELASEGEGGQDDEAGE